MLCKIADLTVEIPELGGMASRLLEYRIPDPLDPQIIIDERGYRPDAWPTLGFEDMVYMESGVQFYYRLLRFGGMMLHASAVELDGRAYLFSGPCGMGKSTHRLRRWQSFTERARTQCLPLSAAPFARRALSALPTDISKK